MLRHRGAVHGGVMWSLVSRASAPGEDQDFKGQNDPDGVEEARHKTSSPSKDQIDEVHRPAPNQL